MQGSCWISQDECFFASVPKLTRQPIEVLEITSSSSEGTSSDLGEKNWVDIPGLATELHLSMTPIPGTPGSDVAEWQSDNSFLNNSTDLVPPAVYFLDLTADELRHSHQHPH